MRDLYELKNLGNYEMIYPCDEDTMSEYARHMDVSKEIWEI